MTIVDEEEIHYWDNPFTRENFKSLFKRATGLLTGLVIVTVERSLSAGLEQVQTRLRIFDIFVLLIAVLLYFAGHRKKKVEQTIVETVHVSDKIE